METVSSANRTYTPFRIKDLMLGELLCQAGIVSDAQLIELTKLARAAVCSLGAAIVFSNVLSPSELFLARRLLNRYLNDLDNPAQSVDELRGLFSNTRVRQATVPAKRKIRCCVDNDVLIRVS